MTTTENLKKHIEELEERRLTLFFQMQNTAGKLNDRLYNFNIVISASALAIFIGSFLIHADNQLFIIWSNIFAICAILIALTQYLSILDKISSKLFRNICTIYKACDDEFFVLKKYNIGELDEQLIRQFYVNKTRELDRYSCTVAVPGWMTWISLSFFLTAIVLLLFV